MKRSNPLPSRRSSRLTESLLGGLLGLSLLAPARAETDWVLVLDRSESMTQNDPYNCRFDAQKIMVDLLAQSAEETHRLSIVRFAGKAEVVLDREVIRPDRLGTIQRTIVNDPPQGDTDIGAALAVARQISKPEGRASDVHVILLSDGVQAGRIPNLVGKLESEKKAYAELGLAVRTILLNDMSMSAEERARRKGKVYYDDKQLQIGEDLLRDLARKTGGKAFQVRPEKGIEDLLIEMLIPHLSYHREPVTRLETVPTDRQLFVLLDRKSIDLKLRLGARELDLSLERTQSIGGDFEVTVNPYRNRTVLMIRPAMDVRWPEWVEFLPGRSKAVLVGDVFVISNIRLSTLPGLSGEDADPLAREGVKTRIQENELYPIRFALSLASDITPERTRSIQDALKRAVVRIRLVSAEGKDLDEKVLPANDIFTGSGNRLYFIPTYSQRGETKIKEPFSVVVRAALEAEGRTSRPMVRAPDRTFTVSPSSFDWVVRRNWKGEPESAARPVSFRDIQLELGQEVRLEVSYSGPGPLPETEMRASFTRTSQGAAQRLQLKDTGGVPRTFHTDWIFPEAPAEYAARVTVKSNGVQEVAFTLRVLRDDYRLPGSEYSRDGSDSARGQDLGSYFIGEKVRFARRRTIHRLSLEETSRYWELETTAPAVVAQLLKKDAAGAWIEARRAPLTVEPPRLGTAEIHVGYAGEISDVEPGEYLITWPEKKPMGPQPESDPRSDRFEVKGRAYAISFVGGDGEPLKVEADRPSVLAGTAINVHIAPQPIFPAPFEGSIVGTLTWARKDVGPPQSLKATRGAGGRYTLSFPTSDFHTGPARLQLVTSWKDGNRERSLEENVEVLSRPKALGIAIEPIEEDLLLGQRGASFRFRLRPIGGQNFQTQRDLLSVWQSKPASATIGDSEEIHEVSLSPQGDGLEGALEMPGLVPGTYKLVVSSPVAKLGQDIAACFFNVKPSPFSASVVKSALGSDQRVVLGPGVHRATCDGDGAVWISLERSGATEVKSAAINLAGAELRLNGKKTEADWAVTEGKLRSSPLALESFERQNTLSVSVTDTRGREFEQVLGKLEVVPVPLKHEVTWTRPPPREMGRGEFTRVEGALTLRGGLRAQRDRAREQILDVNKPFFVATPPSVLKGFEILRAPPPGGEAGASPALFGASVPFIATLRVDAADPAVKDRVLVEVRAEDPASGSVSALEARDVGIGPSTWQLAAGRIDAQGVLVSDEDLPLLARERLRLRIDEAGANAEKSGETFRIQVFAAEGEAGGASKLVASADSRELDWTPRKEGVYRIAAERALGDGSGWATEEKLEILPPLRMEWSGDLGSAIKLDSGQKLPISIRIHGPPGLDQDTFGRWFLLKPEVLAEGGQRLGVEFTDWELSKDASVGTVEASAVSLKPVLTVATKVRVSLDPLSSSTDAGAMDVIDVDLVRGGGSLVLLELEEDEEGSRGRVLKDLSGSFQLAYQKPVRIGYRVGTSLNVGESLERGVAAIIAGPDGSEKVLDVETATTELVVFTPYEPTCYGTHRFHLEIRGKTPLLRDFEFEVVKGTAEWMVVAAGGAVGLLALGIVGFLLLKVRAYGLDRSKARERIRVRKEKALLDLQAEPKESLEGAVRLNVAAAAIGPFQLGGAPSIREVEAWVDQHFSMDASIFSDASKNEKRRPLIEGLLAEARTELLLETEKRLPVRGADVCVRAHPADGKNGGLPRIEAEVVQDSQAPRTAGQTPLISLQILAGGKLRISTSSGKSVTMPLGEEFTYNGWIGKSGNQIRASVKVPGIPDYSTLIIDLKS